MQIFSVQVAAYENNCMQDMRAPKAQLYATGPACTTGQVHLLVYYMKTKRRLSVRHAGNAVIFAWINVILGLCKAALACECMFDIVKRAPKAQLYATCPCSQPLTAKGFCLTGSASDCCTQHLEFKSST